MQIQIHTDNNIKAHETTIAELSSVLESALARFSDHITRLEVHLGDENSNKKDGDDDIRCMIEARLEGRQPVAVTAHAASVSQAVDGAIDKLTRMIDSTLDRLRDQARSRTDLPPVEPIND